MRRRKKGSPRLGADDFRRKVEENDYKCYICESPFRLADGRPLFDHVKPLEKEDLSGLFDERATNTWAVTKYRKARSLGGKNEPRNIDVVCLECGIETKPISVRIPNHMLKDIDMYIEKNAIGEEKTYEDRSEFIKDCISIRLELEKTLLENAFRGRNPARVVSEVELGNLIFSILKSNLGEYVRESNSPFDIEIQHTSGNFGIEIKNLRNRI